MSNEKLESLLIDYLDGALNEADEMTVKQMLDANPDAQRLLQELKQLLSSVEKTEQLQPSASLKMKFEDALAKEVDEMKTRHMGFNWPTSYRIAAAVTLLTVATGVGYWLRIENERADKIAAMERELKANREMIQGMLDDQQSASQRLKGVQVAQKLEHGDNEIANALIKVLNEDPNTNVRLAALTALGKMTQEQIVRKALISSLSNQHDPVIQITLIRLMVEMNEKQILQELQKITTDQEVLPAVRDEAHAGILRLS